MKQIRWFGILQVFPQTPFFFLSFSFQIYETHKGSPDIVFLSIGLYVLANGKQRIALVYFVVALIETLTTKLRPTVLEPGHLSIFTTYKWQW